MLEHGTVQKTLWPCCEWLHNSVWNLAQPGVVGGLQGSSLCAAFSFWTRNMFSFTLCSCVINLFAKNWGLSGFNVVRHFIHMLLLITFLLQVSF